MAAGSDRPGEEATERPRASLVIAGVPAPKGSRSIGRRKDGSTYTREVSPGVKSWVEAVAYSALANRPAGKTLEPPYVVELVFRLPRPTTPTYEWPSTSDIDKLARGVLDGLVQGELLADDRHVIELRACKSFSAPGAAGVTVAVY